MQELRITRPDDWHVHLRDGAALQHTVMHSARYFGRSIVMPNLVPPVTTTERALAYLERIRQQIPADKNFTPLMTLYLSDNTTPAELELAKASKQVYGVKLYPAGATTNSDSGVTSIEKVYPCLERMIDLDLPLLVHGEVTDPDIDIFDRESVFIDRILSKLLDHFPGLKIVLEHISTRQAAEFIQQEADAGVAATITPQHLLFNRNHMLVGGIRPHYYCLPILKRNEHQQALLDLIASDSKNIFLGTDSAPHATRTKENACGCAGCFSTHAALELYAEAFELAGALDKLEAFAAFNGPDFYGLPRNTDTLRLVKKEWQVPASLQFGDQSVTPLRSQENVHWTVVSD
jgi:dihydroorotase